MEPDSGAVITNPAIVLIGLGALSALMAALQWWTVFQEAERIHTPDGGKGRRSFKQAALFTAIALALAGGGFLFGRLTNAI